MSFLKGVTEVYELLFFLSLGFGALGLWGSKNPSLGSCNYKHPDSSHDLRRGLYPLLPVDFAEDVLTDFVPWRSLVVLPDHKP